MLFAALLSLVVALSVVSVPVAMHRILLKVNWQMQSFRWWAAQAAVAVFGIELVMCALYGVAFAAFVGGLFLFASVSYFGFGTWKAWQLQASCKGLLVASKSEASLAAIERTLEHRRRKGARSDA
jgi:hypothetical protein